MLLQVEQIKDIATLEYVSVVGLMLLVIIALGWYVKYLLKEVKEKDNQLIGFIEKYYVIATKINEFLEKKKDV